MDKNKKILAVVVAVVVIAAAGAAVLLSSEEKGLQFGYVLWDGEISSTNVLALVLEEAGIKVDLVQTEAGPLYQGLAGGNLDFTTSSWMPGTHGSYWEKYGVTLDKSGVNLEDVSIGLYIPKHVQDKAHEEGRELITIEDLNLNADLFDGKIYGIEPGAGIMQATEHAMSQEGYNLADYELIPSSSAGMLSELKSSYNKKPIVVTLWAPHWAFEEWELVELEDPDKIYGDAEEVWTVTRDGFKEDHPRAYAIIKEFAWNHDDIESVMYGIFQEKLDPVDAAQKWIDENRDRVEEWIAAGDSLDELGEIGSTAMAAIRET